MCRTVVDTNMMRFFFSFLLVGFCLFAQAQDEDLDKLFKVDYDTPLTIDLDEQEEEREANVGPKKKKKRNVFFGVKTKKHFTRSGFGKEAIYELFNFLKVYEGPPEYAQDFYWYDTKKKKIVNSRKIDPSRAYVLHGPYVKKKGEMILEKGWFFKGLKHKRWVRFNSNDILQDKKYFWKGWPHESLLSYHDAARKQLREIIPLHYGEKEGEYWAYHDDGTLAARGVYKHDYKVGIWREFYPNRRVKREIQYPEDPFDFDFQPIILREWSRDGQVIYNREEFRKQLK